MENNKEELAQKGLKILQKEFLVIGKTHVKSWQAWLALGLIAGVSASIFFVANNRARFFQSSARVQSGDVFLRQRTPIDKLIGVFTGSDKNPTATFFSVPPRTQSQFYLASRSGQEAVLLGAGINSYIAPLPKPIDSAYAPFSYSGYIISSKSAPLTDIAAEHSQKIKELRGELSRTKDWAERESLQKRIRDAEAARKIELTQAKKQLQQGQRETKARLQSIARSLQIKKTYSNAFSGFFAEMSQDDAAALTDAGYEVWPNGQVQAVLSDSVPLINADDVWNLKDADGNPLTGKGIKIAIVDTGVDYTHADLGGCFGALCKVVGGYDVVNDDDDPMDDMGHGTHVASIAAGNGVFKGVAPDASLYAYKVLNSWGSGSFDDVIEGIERAVDPDGDGDFSDGADVINISLGGPGDPDDPVSKTVDNAVRAGAVVAVAAGNWGSATPPYGAIASPGTARDAITVAATDKNDTVAWFSSRGPVYWENKTLMKPDIAAPGVAICAAEWGSWLADLRCKDDKHIAISGTSMAAPHVAGAVALLLQAHPGWQPKEVKAALKTTAKDIEGNTIDRGAGRIDVLAAVNMQAPPVVTLNAISTLGRNRAITGKITAKNLKEWVLSYTPAVFGIGEWKAGEWKELKRSSSLPGNGTFQYLFDSSKAADGSYLFRLSAEDKSGERSLDYGYMYVDKLKLTFPQDGDIFRPGEALKIKFDSAGGVSKAIFEYAPEGGTKWTSLPSGTWKTDGLATGLYSFRVRVPHDGIEDIDQIRVYFDSTLKSGWPVQVNWEKCPKQYGNCTLWGGYYEPVVSDLDGDGKKEVLIFQGGTPPRILIFQSDGKLKRNIKVGTALAAGFNLHIPLVEDIDGDGKKEIFAYNPNFVPPYPGYSLLYAFRENGKLLAGWPIKIPSDYKPTLLAADLDRDGKPEIIMQSRGYPYKVSIISAAGEIISQWDIGTSNWGASIDSTPAVGNFDDDNDLEIVVTKPSPNAGGKFDENGNFLGWVNEGEVHVFNKDGTRLPGWPVLLPGEPFGSPAVGDVDDSGKPEIAVGLLYAADALDAGFGGLYLLDSKGAVMPGWPVERGDMFWSSPSLADLNGDGRPEIISSTVTYPLRTIAYNADGSRVSGWPQPTGWADFYSTVAGDINDDKMPDILASAGSLITVGGGVYAWSGSGKTIPGFPKGTEIDAQAPPVIDDLDGDGKLEIIASSDFDWDFKKQVFKNRGTLYVWQLDSALASTTMHWPTFHHDVERTGLYVPFGQLPPPPPPPPPSLNLLAPNGGQVWQLGSMHTIQWTPYDPLQSINFGPSMTAYLERLEDEKFVTVGKIVESGKASIHWAGEIDQFGNYPQPGEYYIRVENSQTGERDRSDASFTLVPFGTLQADLKINGSDGPLTVPPGGAEYPVAWSSNTEQCSIFNSTLPYGDPDYYLADLPPSGERTMRFLPGGIYGAYVSLWCEAKTKIEGTASDYVFIESGDSSNGEALISGKPFVVIRSPNGGQSLALSQRHEIRWESSGIDHVSLALYKNNAFFSWIARDVPARGAGGSFRWSPAKTISTGDIEDMAFTIYIIGSKTGKGAVNDKSDMPFGIVP